MEVFENFTKNISSKLKLSWNFPPILDSKDFENIGKSKAKDCEKFSFSRLVAHLYHHWICLMFKESLWQCGRALYSVSFTWKAKVFPHFPPFCKMESFFLSRQCFALNSLSRPKGKVLMRASDLKWKWMWKTSWRVCMEVEWVSFEKKFTFSIFGKMFSCLAPLCWWMTFDCIVNIIRFSPPPNAILHNTIRFSSTLERFALPSSCSLPLGDTFSEVSSSPPCTTTMGKLCSHSPCKFCSSSASTSRLAFFIQIQGAPSTTTLCHALKHHGNCASHHPVIISGCHSIWIRKL